MRSLGFFSGLLCICTLLNAALSARPDGRSHFFSPNSILAHRVLSAESVEPWHLLRAETEDFGPVDSLSTLRVLMFDYTAYDSIYAHKIKSFLQKRLPRLNCRDFWQGSPGDLETMLSDRQVVVLPYPARGESNQLRGYGQVLKDFVLGGGTLVITGTHEFDVLRQLDLLDLDYGYYFADPDFHRLAIDHPITNLLPARFQMTNYAYPLDVSDPDYISLADVNDYSALGYKLKGKGAVIYLGMEFYYDEPLSSRLLVNSVLWGSKFAKPATTERPAEYTTTANRPKRITLRLPPNELPGKDSVKIKVYPNPFWDKADLEVVIGQPMPISVEMTDQTGQKTWMVLNRKTLAPGKHVLELPNVPPGVYYVKCKSGDVTNIRRIVKIDGN